MAPVNRTFAVRKYTVNQGVPVKVVAPIDCNFISIRNAGAGIIKIITDTTLPEAWDTINPGVQNLIGNMKIVSYTALPFPGLSTALRFPAGAVICWLESEQDGADVRIQFVT